MKITMQIAAKRDRHTVEVLPSRWVVERTFAWISKHHRTVRDYEQMPASHEAMILWAMIALMTRRFTQPAELSDAHLACRLTSAVPLAVSCRCCLAVPVDNRRPPRHHHRVPSTELR